MKNLEQMRNIREDLDLTQKEVGEMIGISQRTLSHYESGTRDVPVDILIELADVYKVNLDYLVGRTNIKDLHPKKS